MKIIGIFQDNMEGPKITWMVIGVVEVYGSGHIIKQFHILVAQRFFKHHLHYKIFISKLHKQVIFKLRLFTTRTVFNIRRPDTN